MNIPSNIPVAELRALIEKQADAENAAKAARMAAAIPINVADLARHDGATVTVTVILRDVRLRITQQGRVWASALLTAQDSVDCDVELLVPASLFKKHSALVLDGAALTVTGLVDNRDDGGLLLLASTVSAA